MLELALASTSPRRKELLESEGYEFRIFHVKVSEIIDENLNPKAVAESLAMLKARAARDQFKILKSKGFLILSADTVVAMGARVIGKPLDRADAFNILRSLSGKVHRVITGFALLESGTDRLWSGVDTTTVTFRHLSDGAIEDYVNSGEPMDKAGAYGIQGLGKNLVSSYSGSWSNVVGLPLEKLAKVIEDNGWKVRRRKLA